MKNSFWKKIIQSFRFKFEQYFIEGTIYQVLTIVLVIGLISLSGGALVYKFTSQFNSLDQAVW